MCKILFPITKYWSIEKLECYEKRLENVMKTFSILFSLPKWHDIMKSLFPRSSLLGPVLQSEIFCLTAVIVVCSYGVSCHDQQLQVKNSVSKLLWTASRQNISLSSAGPERKLHTNKQQ